MDPAEQRRGCGPSARPWPRSTGARGPRAARSRSGAMRRSIMPTPPRARPPAAWLGGWSTRRSGTRRCARRAGAALERSGPRSWQRGSCAIGQRGWKRQPVGRSIGLGGSPTTAAWRRYAPRHELGNARSRPACTGAAGSVNSSSVGAVSTMRPRYMTATRSQTWRTTAMLCAMSSIVSPSLCAQVLEQVEHRRLHRDVERRDRLVGDEELGLERERARDADALALAARELPRVGVERARAQADELEQLRGSARRRSLRGTISVHAQELAEHLAHGHARVERRVRILEDHLDRAAGRSRRASPASAAPSKRISPAVGS